MWARLEILPFSNHTIFFPSHLKGLNINSIYKIFFGTRSSWAEIKEYRDFSDSTGTDINSPVIIKISHYLLKRLFLIDMLTYQIVINNEQQRIEIGPLLGMLLGNNSHLYHPRYMLKYSDRMGIYSRIGGLIGAFSAQAVDWNEKIVSGLYFESSSSAWKFGSFPLPTVIYRRNFHTDPEIIKRLISFTKGKFFNSHRFTKYELYQYINDSILLREYLPPTARTENNHQITSFINDYKKAILKPVELSRGRGICIIEKQGLNYHVTDYRERTPQATILDSAELENFLAKNPSFLHKYLIQKYLTLATIDECNFDIRVVMQKNVLHEWQCSGIECRVANSDFHLTNISRGGYALPLDEALYRAFPLKENQQTLNKAIHNLSSELCIYLDSMGEHFAEFGLDIALDCNQRLWLIEANVFPSFKGFKTLNYDTYLLIRHTPLLYALSLTNFRQ